MDTIEAIILGIVQGLTEFLPVSSSGHLQIAKALMGVEIEQNLLFDVTLHAATVLSTIVVLWSEVWRLLKGLFSRRFNEEQAYVLKLVLSMIPIGIVGFLLKDRINDLLNAPYILVIVGAMLYGPGGGLLVGLLGAFMGQLLTYGVTATTILWILPQAARGLLVGIYAKHCGYSFSRGQLTAALIGTALVVTALNTGAMYIDSVIYNYYSYAYVFGGLVVRIISGAATAVLMVFVAPPVVNLLNRSLDTVRTAQ